MFRFINSGLKQSVTTFPNSIYHSSNLHKKVNDEEKDNQKLSLVLASRYQPSISIRQTKTLSEIQINIDNPYFLDRRNLIVEFSSNLGAIHVRPFRIGSVFGLPIPRFSVEKPVVVKKPVVVECQRQISMDNDVPEETATNRGADDRNADDPMQKENAIRFSRLGHDLNTKGCEAAAIHDLATALQYWNCAACINYPPAQFNLGAHFESKNDLVAAEKWYRLAIKNGDHPTAAYNLALLLNNKRDDCLKGEIKELMTISANQGSKEAMRCIACINEATR